MPYTTYQFYENTYKGEKLDLEAFEKLVLRASYELNSICHGKINDDTKAKYSEEIQLATCSLTEQINDTIQTDGRDIASETVDKWSRTYATGNNSSIQQRYVNSVYKYLINTGLLYRGV